METGKHKWERKGFLGSAPVAPGVIMVHMCHYPFAQTRRTYRAKIESLYELWTFSGYDGLM